MQTQNFLRSTCALVLISTAAGYLNAPKALALGSHANFNVKSYGATGNGTTDDTAAIQAAITAAGANTGSTLLFPSGTYLYSSVINPVGLNVLGQNGATLLSANNATWTVVDGISPVVQGLNFQAKVAGTQYGLLVTNASNPVVTQTTTGTNFRTGCNVQNSGNVSITQNTFGSPNVTGFAALNLNIVKGGTISNNTINNVGNSDSGMALFSSENLTINSNRVSTTGTSNASGILLFLDASCSVVSNSLLATNTSGSVGIVSNLNNSMQFNSNAVNGWTAGIQSLSDSGVTINSNTVSNSANAGIQALNEASPSTVANNIVTTAGTGIAVAGNTAVVTVSQNQIGSTGNYGIYAGAYEGLAAGGNLSVTGNAIANAGLSSTTTAVIYANCPSATAVSITNNQYKGNTKNLTYFIDAVQSLASVTGNKTNSLLPTQVGP